MVKPKINNYGILLEDRQGQLFAVKAQAENKAAAIKTTEKEYPSHDYYLVACHKLYPDDQIGSAIDEEIKAMERIQKRMEGWKV